MVRSESVGVEEGLDSDETVAEGLKATKSMGSGNEDKIVAGDNVDDEDEEDGGGEETVEGPIQERQELEDDSEVAAPLGEGQEESKETLTNRLLSLFVEHVDLLIFFHRCHLHLFSNSFLWT